MDVKDNAGLACEHAGSGGGVACDLMIARHTIQVVDARRGGVLDVSSSSAVMVSYAC
jgi:hypothetical protein